MTNEWVNNPVTAARVREATAKMVANLNKDRTEPGPRERVAALIEAELFGCYLDAPVRTGASRSILVHDEGTMERTTARDKFEYDVSITLVDPIDDLAENLMAFIETNPDPLYLLNASIDGLQRIVFALREVEQDFSRLTDLTRVAEPDETGDASADEAAHREWELKPLYRLPEHPA